MQIKKLHGQLLFSVSNLVYSVTVQRIDTHENLLLKNRQVQKSDRINSDCQSESDQLGSTRILSDHEKT